MAGYSQSLKYETVSKTWLCAEGALGRGQAGLPEGQGHLREYNMIFASLNKITGGNPLAQSFAKSGRVAVTFVGG